MKIYLHAAVIMVFCSGCVACVWLVSGGLFGQTKYCTVTLFSSSSSGPVVSHRHCLFIWSFVLVSLVRFLLAQHLMFLWVMGLHFLTGFIIHMCTGGWQVALTLADPNSLFLNKLRVSTIVPPCKQMTNNVCKCVISMIHSENYSCESHTLTFVRLQAAICYYCSCDFLLTRFWKIRVLWQMKYEWVLLTLKHCCP